MWLDLRIAFYTLMFLFKGERRFEHAVRAANELQQANVSHQGNGQLKSPMPLRAEPREIRTGPIQPPARLPITARARANQRLRANSLD